MFKKKDLNRRDKRILKALLYFYPRKKSASEIYNYISRYSQKNGVKGPKALGHILSKFPVDTDLTVVSTMTGTRIVNSRYIRLYVLHKSFVMKYYKEKNELIKLSKKKSQTTAKKKNVRSSSKKR
ncbi:MAG: hypothetical protein K9N07_07775 [Candidatus Cloacimonetes bacterium]|nr:hypothetical protein [Candidatus Cloacimonadota bacterium]MCF8012773.1 hypothetical protein [Candidatus Woesearchaeota archaeon]